MSCNSLQDLIERMRTMTYEQKQEAIKTLVYGGTEEE